MSMNITPESIMKDFSKKMEALKTDEASLRGIMSDQPYIVVNFAGLPLAFEFSHQNGQTTVNQPRIVSRPSMATTFTKRDAMTVAKNVFDGANRPGVAKTILQATRDSIAELQEVMDNLNEAMLKKAS